MVMVRELAADWAMATGANIDTTPAVSAGGATSPTAKAERLGAEEEGKLSAVYRPRTY